MVTDEWIEPVGRGLSDKPTGLINERVRQTGAADLTGY